MNYCQKCGEKLIKQADSEGQAVDYCPQCQHFYYPSFNSAISMIIVDQAGEHVMLANHVNDNGYVLFAGYINKGENANEAVVRELYEETQLKVDKLIYNDNRYYEKTNTLIHNYIVVVKNGQVRLNHEIEEAKWVPCSESLAYIRPHSLAKEFLTIALPKIEKMIK